MKACLMTGDRIKLVRATLQNTQQAIAALHIGMTGNPQMAGEGTRPEIAFERHLFGKSGRSADKPPDIRKRPPNVSSGDHEADAHVR